MKNRIAYWFFKIVIVIYAKIIAKVKPCAEKASYMYRMGEVANQLVETGDLRLMALGLRITLINLDTTIDDLKQLTA